MKPWHKLLFAAWLPLVCSLLLLSWQCPAAQTTFFLHSATTNAFLDASTPTGPNFQTSSSPTIDRTNFVEIGTWSAAPAAVYFDLTTVGDLSIWIGRRFTETNGNSGNSENTGTFFDIRAEVLKNGGAVDGAVGLVTFIRNVKADPDKAHLVVIPFGSIANAGFSRGDVLSLRVSAKVADSSGQPDAPGASLFFDSADHPAGFGITYFVVPEISISSATIDEGNTGTTNAILTANLSVPSERPAAVDYATADGTATLADSDYQSASGTLNFAPGETNKTVTVQINGDVRAEPDETLSVNLSNAVHAIIATASGSINIKNDDLNFAPVVTITSPRSGLITNSTPIEVNGTAGPGSQVRIEGGAVTVTNGADASGNFSVLVPLRTNALNHLFAIGTDALGNSTAPQPLDVTHDAQPPSLFIDFPPANAELAIDTIDVAGRVGDLLSGFMGLAVTVNGQPATVDVGIGNNGTFVRGAVSLSLGTNVLTAAATDTAGNTITRQISVKRVAVTGPRMVAVSGNAQIANVHAPLINPIVVQVTETNGAPFANKLVTFTVIRSDGRLVADPFAGIAGVMTLQAHTDANGLASAYWTLGGDAGCGNNRVAATSKDIAGSVFFCASANPARPGQINIGSGNNQRAEAGGPAGEPLRAWVNDSCNGVPNIPVTFTVLQGGGRVNGSSSVTVLTSATGHSQVDFNLGPETGNNIVEANFPGNPGNPATFIIHGLKRDPAKLTSFTGLILDNASQPIGNAICSLTVGGITLMTASDVQGQFAFTNTPSGRGDLFVNGLTANSLGGSFISPNSFPFLSYSVTVVPNAENSLSMPVLLPRLNPNNNVVYRGTNDLVLTCEGMAGLKMTIKANSMRKSDGSLVTPFNPAVVSLNQVHHDKVPMPIPDGAAPPFTWTLQPARSTFDPPIQIEYPNMSGLPAGSIAFFLSFNHDTEKFEIIASGHVVGDGSVIVTDPGGGLSLAGWGCNCPPYSVTGSCEDDKCKRTADTLQDTYNQSTGAARAFHHQVACIAQVSCSSPWAGAFVKNLLGDIAENRRNGIVPPTDPVCGLIPGWIPISDLPFNASDICAVFAGVNHFLTELKPGFAKYACQYDPDQLRQEHEAFFNNAVSPCFLSVDELSPLARLLASQLIPILARNLRDSTLSMCPGGPASYSAGQRPLVSVLLSTTPTAAELYSTNIAAASALRVTVQNSFFLSAGASYQIRVTDRNGRDLTSSSQGTLYFAATDSTEATITPDGLLTILATSSPIQAAPHLLYVIVKNGSDTGVGQFAIQDVDSDGDGIVDSFETRVGMDPHVVNAPSSDLDGDSVPDVFECLLGTDPLKPDTDGDGLNDGVELAQGSNPMDSRSKNPKLPLGTLLTVNGQSWAADADGSFKLYNVSAPDLFGADGPGSRPDFLSDDFLRLTGVTTVAGRRLYFFSEHFQIRQGVSFSIDSATDLTFTETPPPSPVSLRMTVDNPTLNAISQTTQLHVTGTLQNGSQIDLTPRTSWTVYRTSNPQVATVDKDGLVTAHSSGVVFFTAVNEGASAVARAIVALGDPLTVVEGFVRGADNAPVSGAAVSVVGQSATGITDTTGHFSISGVATVLGNIRVQATYQGSSALSPPIAPNPGGVTDAGIIRLPPPVIALVAPAPTDTLYEGSTIPVVAVISTNATIVSVKFAANGVDLVTLTGPPYAIQYPIGIGVVFLTLAVTATDNGGISTTVQRTWTVQLDPLTTVTGIVRGLDTLPASGLTVRVFESTNVSGADGRFTIPGIRTFRGDIVAHASGFFGGTNLAGSSAAVAPVRGGVTDVGSIQLRAIIGLPNGGFEAGNFTGFQKTGNSVVTNRFGSLLPAEGVRMAFFSTGVGAVNNVSSSITTDPFVVPAGMKFLTFEYNFVSDEFPQYIGSEYDDDFRALLVSPSGTNGTIITSVNRANFVVAPTDAGFSGMSGVITVQIGVSNYAGLPNPSLSLTLRVSDVGDSQVDSGALVDNLRFEPDVVSGAVMLQLTSQAIAAAVPNAVLSVGGPVNGKMELKLCGSNRSTYVVEATTDLIHWAPISTNLCTGGSVTINDPENTSSRFRYYRAVRQPRVVPIRN